MVKLLVLYKFDKCIYVIIGPYLYGINDIYIYRFISMYRICPLSGVDIAGLCRYLPKVHFVGG